MNHADAIVERAAKHRQAGVSGTADRRQYLRQGRANLDRNDIGARLEKELPKLHALGYDEMPNW